MRRKSAFVALLSLSFAAIVAFAQPSITPVEVRQPGVAPAPTTQGEEHAAPAKSHDDADARACLEFLTNIGVIRCAEKYRHPRQRPAH
jgi:hypothetical protein